jgi:predicted nucleic acid-binding protein
MLYLDTSALVKLVRREPESDTLADWLDAQTPAPWVSSMLIEVELPRALRRVEPALLADVPAIVARVARYNSTRWSEPPPQPILIPLCGL